MADSIAKLAVIITGDASPLARTMGDATQIVRRFDSEATGAFVGGARGLKAMGDAAQVAGGHLRGLVGFAGLGAATAGPLLAIAGIAKGAFELASAADSLNKTLGASEVDTWAGQWKRLSDNIGTAAGILGQPLAAAARDASSAFADLAESFNEWLRPGITAELAAIAKAEETAKQQAKQQAEAKKAAAEAERKRVEAAKEASEAAERERDAFTQWQNRQRQAAESIKQSVQTPMEELREKFVELKQLFADGFLDETTFTRAGQQALDAFRKARGDIQRESRSGVAAADRFTMAGFSAMEGGKRELERTAKAAEEQLAVAKDAKAIEQQILEVIRGQPRVMLVEGSP